MFSISQKGITLEKNSGRFKKTEGADPITVPRNIARKTAPLESLDSPVEHSGVLKPNFSVVLHRHSVQNGPGIETKGLKRLLVPNPWLCLRILRPEISGHFSKGTQLPLGRA